MASGHPKGGPVDPAKGFLLRPPRRTSGGGKGVPGCVAHAYFARLVLTATGAFGALVEARDEDGVRRATSGVAELGTTRPVPSRSRFRIGSITKTFLATVVLQLVDEGRLELDDPVETWLPGVVPKGHEITVRHLVNHTSGLYGDALAHQAWTFATADGRRRVTVALTPDRLRGDADDAVEALLDKAFCDRPTSATAVGRTGTTP